VIVQISEEAKQRLKEKEEILKIEWKKWNEENEQQDNDEPDDYGYDSREYDILYDVFDGDAEAYNDWLNR
jgi:hypothetical protein